MTDARQRRIQIKVPETYQDVDEKVWKDLEEYLFTGFLASSANLLGKTFVFKTLNHQELRNIEYLRTKSGDLIEINSNFKAAFIAYSLFIALGQNVLYKRADHIEKLIGLASHIPKELQDKIIDNLNSLNKRASRLYPLVEIYVHEPRSRYRWLYLKKLPVHSTSATGISGTEELGMNYCQQTWVAMNEVLDRKDDAEISWQHSKFVGSCFAGKGMASVDEQDKARRNRERQELEDHKNQVINEYLGNIASGFGVKPKTIQLPDGRQAVVEGRFKAESVEELADQLSAALSGEKDWHDAVVDEYFKRSRAEQEAREKQRNKMASMPRQDLIDAGKPVAGIHVLDKKDADEYVRRMQALMINSPQAVSPPNVDEHDVDRSGLRNRKRNG